MQIHKQKKYLPYIGIWVLIAWFAVYTTNAVWNSLSPLQNKQLYGWDYLATEATECKTCNFTQYYRKESKTSSCQIKKVITSTTRHTIHEKSTSALSIEDQSFETRKNKKGEKKYLFDSQAFARFNEQCKFDATINN